MEMPLISKLPDLDVITAQTKYSLFKVICHLASQNEMKILQYLIMVHQKFGYDGFRGRKTYLEVGNFITPQNIEAAVTLDYFFYHGYDIQGTRNPLIRYLLDNPIPEENFPHEAEMKTSLKEYSDLMKTLGEFLYHFVDEKTRNKKIYELKAIPPAEPYTTTYLFTPLQP